MRKSGLIYNFLLFFIVLVLFTEIYVLMHDKRSVVLNPDPSLGTQAQTIFTTYDQAEIFKNAFGFEAKSALCESYPTLHDYLQTNIKKTQFFEKELLAQYEQTVSEKLSARVSAWQWKPNQAVSTKSEYVLFVDEKRTVVYGSTPWIIQRATKQGDVQFATRMNAEIPASIPLKEIADTITEIKLMKVQVEKRNDCIGSTLTQQCIRDEVSALAKKHTAILFTPFLTEMENAAGKQDISVTVQLVFPAPLGCSDALVVDYSERFPVLSVVNPES